MWEGSYQIDIKLFRELFFLPISIRLAVWLTVSHFLSDFWYGVSQLVSEIHFFGQNIFENAGLFTKFSVYDSEFHRSLVTPPSSTTV